MNNIYSTPRFQKSHLKFIKKFPFLKDKIEQTLNLLKDDIYSPFLHTHKLSGNLFGLFACSCGFDCRIVFSLEIIENVETIVLLYIGTHEAIY